VSQDDAYSVTRKGKRREGGVPAEVRRLWEEISHYSTGASVGMRYVGGKCFHRYSR